MVSKYLEGTETLSEGLSVAREGPRSQTLDWHGNVSVSQSFFIVKRFGIGFKQWNENDRHSSDTFSSLDLRVFSRVLYAFPSIVLWVVVCTSFFSFGGSVEG